MEAIRQQRIENRRIARPKLEVLVKRARGVPFVEGLRMAEKRGLVIASNRRLDNALIESNDEWKSISDAFPCWSGTMTAYKKPGEQLGAVVEYKDHKIKERWVFPVPKEYQKEKDAILVAEHPDYTLEIDGKNIVVNAKAVDIVSNFPATDHWYPGYETHRIPIVGSSYDNRYLWRTDSRVVPVLRGYGWRGVVLNEWPSSRFGMVVKADKNTKEGDEI